jgi:hypothetical protein
MYQSLLQKTRQPQTNTKLLQKEVAAHQRIGLITDEQAREILKSI